MVASCEKKERQPCWRRGPRALPPHSQQGRSPPQPPSSSLLAAGSAVHLQLLAARFRQVLTQMPHQIHCPEKSTAEMHSPRGQNPEEIFNQGSLAWCPLGAWQTQAQTFDESRLKAYSFLQHLRPGTWKAWQVWLPQGGDSTQHWKR